MKKSFSFIALHIESSKIKAIINDGLGYNEDIFKEIKKAIPKSYRVEGFSSIQKVPFNSYRKLTQLLFENNGLRNNTIAKLILKGWFYKNENLKDLVKTNLISRGYEINDLNFIKNSLEIKPLKKEDLFTTTDELNYFRPKGKKIESVDEVESTLMAALYGWIALSETAMNKTENNIDNDTNVDEHIEKETIIDNKPENQSNKEQDITRISIDSLIEELNQEFKKESEFFLQLSKDLEQGLLPDSNIIQSRINYLTEKFNSAKNIFDESGELITNSLNELEIFYRQTKENESKIKENTKTVLDILDKINTICHKRGQAPSFIEVLKQIANNLHQELTNNGIAQQEWYIQLISKQHFFNFLIQAILLADEIEPDYAELDRLLSNIKIEFANYKLDFYEQLAAQINRNNLMFQGSPSTNLPPDKTTKNSIVNRTSKDENETIDDPLISKQEPVDTIEVETKVNIPEEEIVIELTNQTAELLEINNTKEDEIFSELKNEVSIKPQEKQDSNITPVNNEQIKPCDPLPLVNITDEKGKKLDELDVNEEDRNILKLLERNEPELAYHLAKCYENENKELFIPTYILQNLFLSQKIKDEEGPVAQMIASNIDRYDLTFEKSDKGYLKNSLIFSTILRPSIFAFNTSKASLVLSEIHPGKVYELLEIKKLILDFMNQFDGTINIEILYKILGDNQLKEQKEKFLLKLTKWIEKAQHIKYRNIQDHHYSIAYNNWIKTDGWINKTLTSFIEKNEIKILTQLLLNELNEASWRKKFDKELKIVNEDAKHPSKNLYDNKDAVKWITFQLEGLKELIKEGLMYYSDNSISDFTDHKNELYDFLHGLLKESTKVICLLDSVNSESFCNRISKLFLKQAFNNLVEILTGKETNNDLPPFENLMNAPLLRLPYYESEFNWSPKYYNHLLIKSCISYLEQPKKTFEEICKMHLESGNLEAYNRFKSITNPEEGFANNAEGIEDFSSRLDFDIKTTIMVVERGCAYGFISDGLRTSLIASIEEIRSNQKHCKDGVNYPLRKSQLEVIQKRAEFEKHEAITTHKMLIPGDIKYNEKEILEKYLANGNILVFNETLERIKNGQFELVEEVSGIFKQYFQDFLSNNNGKNSDFILKSIQGKKTLYGVDFGAIAEHQAKEAETIMTKWYFIKNHIQKNEIDDFENLKIILEGLGFISAELISNATKRRKSVYFDFKCNPIKGKYRTPLPQFGSIVKGNYRLIIFRERLNEEDLIEEIKELSPDTDRAVLVFNFFWMDQKSRLELTRLSLKSRITFLMLDESMLVYLCGVKGSKLPIFIRLSAPFTFVEPYQTSSSNLPEEMFYGRYPQIQKLKNITGDFSCLIYGGRQLGKTVLQREVERIFHNPEKNNYAIFIDLRDSGIGLWKPIEEITSVLIENLKIVPGLIPDKIQPNIKLDALLLKFKEWFDNNMDSRIILFLDESDRFLEQDAEKEWRHILPLKGLMEKTDKRFKIILAGLHDVRRTNKIPNNPLAHFGNPICVGPMLDREEAIEAQLLIKTPLESIGYEFESEDLVLMILSHCNWYPSLIQIFCNKLLNVLHEKRNFSQLPIIITDKDVTKAYNRSREQIKEKFSLTLSLDERYNLLANIIAGESIENPSIQITGISVEEITELSIIAWPDGFDSTNPKLEVRNFLEEMVDLGVLRHVSGESFALRTPNLLDLIGTEKQIKDNLNQKERTLPQEFKRQVSRIIYNSSGKREQRSPFPAYYYDRIMDVDNYITIIRGSKAGGLDNVEEFLKSRKKEIHLIYPEFNNSTGNRIEELWESLDKKRISGKRNIIFFNYSTPFTTEDILQLNDKIYKKSDLSALFLLDPKRIWDLLSQNDNSFEKIENHNIPIISIPQWKEDIAKEWFKETGCVNANIAEIFDITGNWHYLLDKYHAKIFPTPEAWREHLSVLESEMYSSKPELLVDFGLNNSLSIKILKELIEWDGGLTKQEFITEYQNPENLFEAKNYLDYFLFLNLINNELKVNHIVKKLLLHG